MVCGFKFRPRHIVFAEAVLVVAFVRGKATPPKAAPDQRGPLTQRKKLLLRLEHLLRDKLVQHSTELISVVVGLVMVRMYGYLENGYS